MKWEDSHLCQHYCFKSISIWVQSQQDTIHSIYSADTLEEWATASLPPCTYHENTGVQVSGFVNGMLTLTNMLFILKEYNNAIFVSWRHFWRVKFRFLLHV